VSWFVSESVSQRPAAVQSLSAVAVRICWLRQGTVRGLGGRGTSAVGSRYQTMAVKT
jgi:hypothetical protein